MRSRPCAGEIAGMSAGGALSEEHAHADGTRAGFLQRLDLAEADEGGEFVAFADDAFGGGGATCMARRTRSCGEVFSFSFGFEFREVVSSHKSHKYFTTEHTETQRNLKLKCVSLSNEEEILKDISVTLCLRGEKGFTA